MFDTSRLVKLIKKEFRGNMLSVVYDEDIYVTNRHIIVRIPPREKKIVAALTECFGAISPNSAFGQITSIKTTWDEHVNKANQDLEFTRFSYQWTSEEGSKTTWILRAPNRLILVDRYYLDLLEDPMEYTYRISDESIALNSPVVVSRAGEAWMIVAPCHFRRPVPVKLLITNTEEEN